MAAPHRRALNGLTALSAAGLVPYAWGLWVPDPWAVVAGIILITGATTWFIDRCAWVWADFTAAGGGPADLGSALAPRPPRR